MSNADADTGTDRVRCPGCHGEVCIPAQAAGDIPCPVCRTTVQKGDPQTGARWRPAASPGPGRPVATARRRPWLYS